MGSQTIGGRMSECLLKFLKDYLAWVERGAPCQNQFRFYRGYALCDNITNTLWAGASNVYFGGGSAADVKNELHAMFANEGLDSWYPFGEDEFREGHYNHTHHENEDRLAWVRKQLEVQ